MRDSVKITVKYQFCMMLLQHLAAAGVTFVFGMVAFWYFLSRSVWKELLSVVFIAVYFILLYSKSKKFAALDNKTYTPLEPKLVKGFMFGGAIAAAMLVFFALYELDWQFFSEGDSVIGVIPTAVNAIFYFLSFPYNGLMNMHCGAITWYSVVLMAVVPIAACGAGYYAGIKNIQIMEKIESFMYEKE